MVTMRDPLVAKLIEIRDREGLSSAAMARRLGVNPSYLHLVLKGERAVGRKMLDGAIREFPEVHAAYARALTFEDVSDTESQRPSEPASAAVS